MIVSFDSQMLCESLMWAWYAAEQIETENGSGYCYAASSFVDGSAIGSSIGSGGVSGCSISSGAAGAAFTVDQARVGSSLIDGCRVGASFMDE